MKTRRRLLLAVALLAATLVAATLAMPPLLAAAGRFLVRDDHVAGVDCAAVLATGVDYYPRLMEAAALFREGRVARVAINGNRKSDELRRLEALGYQPPAPWYESALRILELLGVPRGRVLTISAEDAYDTVSEARRFGRALHDAGCRSVAVTTSKSHSRRAAYIWERLHGERLEIHAAPAREDPYDPAGWWRSGRQVRWVLAEYGAWLYLHWKLRDPATHGD